MTDDRQERFRRAFDVLKAAGHTQASVARLLGLSSGRVLVNRYLRGRADPSEPIVRLIELHAGLRDPDTKKDDPDA